VRRLVIVLGATEVRAEVRSGCRTEWQGSFAASPSELEVALRQLAAEPPPGRLPRRLLLQLAPPLVQRRTLGGLPPVRRRELAELVAHNAARYFRQNGHPLVTAGTWESRPGANARLAAAEAHLLEGLLASARAAGFEVEDIVPCEPGGAGLSLLPAAERSSRTRSAWRKVGIALGVAVAAWTFVAAAVVVHLVREERRLGRELAALEVPRESLARVRREAGAVEATLRALLHDEAERHRLASHLALVAGVLPRDGIADRVELTSTGRGEVSGRAPNPAALVARLSRSIPAMLTEAPGSLGAPTDELQPYRIRLGSESAP
jgi:hypothetical protein